MSYIRILLLAVLIVIIVVILQWISPPLQRDTYITKEYHLLKATYVRPNCFLVPDGSQVGKFSFPPSYCYDGQCCRPYCLWVCNPDHVMCSDWHCWRAVS